MLQKRLDKITAAVYLQLSPILLLELPDFLIDIVLDEGGVVQFAFRIVLETTYFLLLSYSVEKISLVAQNEHFSS